MAKRGWYHDRPTDTVAPMLVAWHAVLGKRWMMTSELLDVWRFATGFDPSSPELRQFREALLAFAPAIAQSVDGRALGLRRGLADHTVMLRLDRMANRWRVVPLAEREPATPTLPPLPDNTTPAWARGIVRPAQSLPAAVAAVEAEAADDEWVVDDDEIPKMQDATTPAWARNSVNGSNQ